MSKVVLVFCLFISAQYGQKTGIGHTLYIYQYCTCHCFGEVHFLREKRFKQVILRYVIVHLCLPSLCSVQDFFEYDVLLCISCSAFNVYSQPQDKLKAVLVYLFSLYNVTIKLLSEIE